MLDGFRAVTANMQADAQLTEAQRAELVQAYERLEEYLVASDPLRSFTREELRGRLAPGFSRRVEHAYPLKTPDLVQ
jgi:Txe/YoeB family toxin of Txe-Axe toxin-antitoxin module